MSASVEERLCSALGHFWPIRGSRCPSKDISPGVGPFQKQLYLRHPFNQSPDRMDVGV
jgi:hypothetical protein